MTSREKILSRVKRHQPASTELTPVNIAPMAISNPLAKFKDVLISIGGAAIEIRSEDEIVHHLSSILPGKQDQRIVGMNPLEKNADSPHGYQNTDITILRAEFAVAENGSVWVTDAAMIDRALPFICAHLIVIVRAGSIVPTMHDAYDRIGRSHYEFGTFIAGPSKTADIEQSLVLGAHGAKTLTCIIVSN